MKTFSITIPGEAIGQGRPQFNTKTKTARDPAKSRNQKAFIKYLVADEVKKEGWEVTDKPVRVEIQANLLIPTSASKKKQEQMANGEIRPTKKPDVDNIYKLVTDAMSGLVYLDDKQVWQAVVQKQYAYKPEVFVKVYGE